MAGNVELFILVVGLVLYFSMNEKSSTKSSIAMDDHKESEISDNIKDHNPSNSQEYVDAPLGTADENTGREMENNYQSQIEGLYKIVDILEESLTKDIDQLRQQVLANTKQMVEIWKSQSKIEKRFEKTLTEFKEIFKKDNPFPKSNPSNMKERIEL
ncbi:uncharacterized protein LOC111519591 [Drosophila willistoni]|uniref:uncharacterized protein LOC111519591 n=1 Tax=Drosophila willistoni TaxID=7260 RepID=UPI000C26D14D|nr:uncharacterized protein LOC111519591 [Drosophila willistoni]XP_023036920.1 uncharacterized protein LOC111519591 [Drosophila willistoni]XP_046865572.1 uncharacterized protein LOC111519591 [Drosophila willistoni]XP_046865573.1 uncharacterized protein LOC111519591 [Drosophila willistoni]